MDENKRYASALPTNSEEGALKIYSRYKIPCITATYHKGLAGKFGQRPYIMETEARRLVVETRITERGLRPVKFDGGNASEYGTIPFDNQKASTVQVEHPGHVCCVAQRARSYRGEPSHLEESPEAGKTNCLTTVCKDNLIIDNIRIRRLTPTECARLQTIPEWYKWECSETQQYRMLGNGWNVETIKHILSFMKI